MNKWGIKAAVICGIYWLAWSTFHSRGRHPPEFELSMLFTSNLLIGALAHKFRRTLYGPAGFAVVAGVACFGSAFWIVPWVLGGFLGSAAWVAVCYWFLYIVDRWLSRGASKPSARSRVSPVAETAEQFPSRLRRRLS